MESHPDLTCIIAGSVHFKKHKADYVFLVSRENHKLYLVTWDMTTNEKMPYPLPENIGLIHQKLYFVNGINDMV